MEFDQWSLAYRAEERVAGIGPAPDGWPEAADLDRPAEALLRLLGDRVEVVRIGGADDQHVDIVRYRPEFALVARGPRSMDECAFDTRHDSKRVGEYRQRPIGHRAGRSVDE